MNENQVLRRLTDSVLDVLTHAGEALPKELVTDGQSVEDRFRAIGRWVIANSPDRRDPHFFLQVYGPPDPVAIEASHLVQALKLTMATQEGSGVFTQTENEVIDWGLRMIGFRSDETPRKGAGIGVSGGSAANIQAMMYALNAVCPESVSRGLFGVSPQVALVSSQSHYSLSTSAITNHIGTQNLVSVGCDKKGRMDPDQLRDELEQVLKRSDSAKPFFVVLTAGTSILGAIDPIEACMAVCREFERQHSGTKIWIHVDACLLGPFLLTSWGQTQLKGIAKADSVAINFHKAMQTTLTCSALFIREAEKMDLGINAQYLLRDEQDLGNRSVDCARSATLFPVWVLKKVYGEAELKSRLNQMLKMAARFEERIRGSDLFEVPCPLQSVTVGFCLKNAISRDDAEKQLIELVRHLKTRGIVLNTGTIPDGRLVIRPTFTDPRWTDDQIDGLVDTINEVGRSIILQPVQVESGAA